MQAVQNMNGTIWVFASILIALVLVQSWLFLQLALKFNKKHNLVTDAEMKEAVKTGAIAAIGPSINSIVVALSLIAMVGSATTFMRCGVIGAPVWELYMANIAASAAGVEFGSAEFTEAVFTMCIFCMVLGSAPYFLNTMIMLKPLDTMVEKTKEAKAKISFVPYLSTSAMFGLLTYSILDNWGKVGFVPCVVGSALAYIGFEKLAKKLNNPGLSSFSLAVAMVAGMACGQIYVSLMG